MPESINDRLRLIRKTCKKSQEDFGKVIGITKSGVSDIENGRRNVTEQHIIMLRNWSEYNVNEDWLRTGSGKMFMELPPEDEFIAAAAELSRDGDKVAMQTVIEYWKLDSDSKKLFKDFLLKVVENSKNKE